MLMTGDNNAIDDDDKDQKQGEKEEEVEERTIATQFCVQSCIYQKIVQNIKWFYLFSICLTTTSVCGFLKLYILYPSDKVMLDCAYMQHSF
jgi:hypothetical protein